MNEFSDSLDPGTQLVRSLSLMIGTLQSDLEQKRISDQNLVKAILQGTLNEQAKGEISQKAFDAKVAEFENRI